MKKIVGILAAAAMAASVFAVDVTSMIQIDGDVLNYDGKLKAIQAKDFDPQGTSDYVFKLAASGDAAGAEIWYFNPDGDKEAEKAYFAQYSLWLKPADGLKVTVGNVYDCSIFNPQFGWWAKNVEFSKYGYAVDFNKDALGITFAMAPGKGNYWFNANNDGWGKVGDFWLDVTYNLGNAGQVQAIVTKGANYAVHGLSNWGSVDGLMIDVVYGNQPYMQTGYFIDAGVVFTPDFEFKAVAAQIGGQYCANGLTVQGTVPVVYQNDLRVGAEVKVGYAVNAFKPYVQIDGYNMLGNTNWGDGSWTGAKAISVKLGCGANVGTCSIDAGLMLPIAFENYSFNFSVPVQFTVNL